MTDKKELREMLLRQSDLAAATALSNEIGDVVTRHLNASRVGMGTALVTLALIANGILQVGGAWWSDMMPALERQDCLSALADIATEPPVKVYVDFDSSSIQAPTGKPN